MAKARKILAERLVRGDVTVEMVIWQVPEATPDRPHRIKYRLFCGRSGGCVVRYDNETGKGDHLHYGDRGNDYRFTSVSRLLSDFLDDVERLTGWRIE